MNSKVNKNFIKEMQSELDRKSEEYDGKDNPSCYLNMPVAQLLMLISDDVEWLHQYRNNKAKCSKLLTAISNRCGMIWEKLNEN